MKNTNPWVVVEKPGQDDEKIVADFARFMDASYFAFSNGYEEGEADIMKRRADGTLTTEF